MRRTRFITWCKRDVEDERKINYEFKSSDGNIYHFTSEDEVTYQTIRMIANAWIESIELINDEWYAVLYED